MTLAALVMAGGAGERMQSAVPKPLVAIRGATLLERNVCALLGAGIRAIWIACSSSASDGPARIRAEIERLGRSVAGRGVALVALPEPEPLGTIGAAGQLAGSVDTLVTVNADNLTTLDPAVLIAHHARTAADLVLATHDHATRLPYGEVIADGADDNRVIAYREKPITIARVASALGVLGPRALAAASGRVGLDALVGRVLAANGRVVAYHHGEPWIDVNEPADVERAGALVAAHARLECWSTAPDLEVAGALVRDDEHLLLERRGDVWDTPGGKLESAESAAAAIVRELAEELGIRVAAGPELAVFDTLEPDGRAIRHHVFAPRCERAAIAAREQQILEWFPLACLPRERSPVVDRSLSALRRTS